MSKRVSCIGFLAAGLLFVPASFAQSQPAQQPPPKPPEQEKAKPAPAKKAKRVWSDDDVKGLRKPWDEHADKKVAEEDSAKAAAAAEKAGAGKTEAAPAGPIDPSTGKPYVDPESPEGLEQQLKKWEEDLKSTEELAAQARKEMGATTDQDRWESAKLKAETYEANIVDMQGRIEALKVKLAEAKKGKPAPKPAKAPSEPSQPQS